VVACDGACPASGGVLVSLTRCAPAGPAPDEPGSAGAVRPAIQLRS